MISEEDIVEIVLEELKKRDSEKEISSTPPEQAPARQGKWGFFASRPYSVSYTSVPSKRLFMSEYDIKQLVCDGKKTLKVPVSAIVSPLAQEWLDTRGIKVEKGE